MADLRQSHFHFNPTILRMSMLCCCRSSRTTCRGPVQEDAVELPTEPPRARLSKSLSPMSEIELSSLPVVVPLASSLLHTSIQQAAVDPAVLEVEDSDDDDLVRDTRTRNSSTGTLVAIKTKLIRRLSQKSELKRHSQQSLGTSDEEIARRAELKRLMHKRIQEELESEEEHKEEASVNTSNPEEPQQDLGSQTKLPGGGPRDAIEFSVSGVHETRSNDLACIASTIIPLAFPVREVQSNALRRRSSCPGSTSQSRETSDLDCSGALKERGSLPQLPSCPPLPYSPKLSPVRSPSVQGSESVCSSWRLSYSAGQLESYLGVHDDLESGEGSEFAEPGTQQDPDQGDKEPNSDIKSLSLGSQGSEIDEQLSETTQPPQQALSHDKQETISNANASEGMSTEGISMDNFHDITIDMDSPLDIWLRSQELQANSVVSSRRNSDMILQLIPESPSQEVQSHTSQDIDGPKSQVRSSHEPPDPTSLSQHGPPGAWPQTHSSHSDTESISIYQYNEIPHAVTQRTNDPSDANLGMAGRTPAESSSHYTSSRYTTRTNSRQPTPKESRLSIMGVFGARKVTSPLPPFHPPNWSAEAEKSDVSSYKTAPNDISTPDLVVSDAQQLRRPMVETTAMGISETASFKQREEELRSIEKRFGQVHARREPSIPIASRFHEEFDEARASRSGRQSLFAKLHLPLTRKAKHSMKDEADGKLVVTSSKGLKPRDTEGTISQRQQVVSPETDCHEAPKCHAVLSNTFLQHADGARGTSLPISKQGNNGTGESDPDHISPTVKSPKVEPGSTLKPPPRPEPCSTPRSDISNFVLKKWVDQLDSEDSMPQEPRLEPQPQAARRYRTPPASWAKWPSHTRHERAGPAGEGDSVIPQDFALRVGSGGSRMTWTTDNPGEPSQRDATPSPRTLSSRFGQVVKDGLSRMLRGKDTLESNSRDSPEVYRGKPDGNLEYPELEILPMRGGYKELQALEQQIDSMKHRSVSSKFHNPRASADSTKPPLATWLAEEIHKIRHGDDASSQNGGGFVVGPLEDLKVTPSQALAVPRAVSGTTEQSETPQSHVSYDDCVLKHMLEDEEGSIRRMSTAIGERPRARTIRSLTFKAIATDSHPHIGNKALTRENQGHSWYGKPGDDRQLPLPQSSNSVRVGNHERKALEEESGLTGTEARRISKENQYDLLSKTPSTSTI
ncbi:hypothetical protein F5B20DRAFT_324517 [Whalleya microplaca]|nr:hypothetical protein F5B20DRAFT_324517 [Whalleya microplaca]